MHSVNKMNRDEVAKEPDAVDIFYWIVIVLMIVIAFAGLIYPVIPGVLFLALAFVLYGFFFSFEPLNWLFWAVQLMLTALIFLADYVTTYFGVKKTGGTKAGIWGSTIGLIAGPFVIPVAGIVIGPFLGAVAGELLFSRVSLKKAIWIGLGSVMAFIGSTLAKLAIQLFMTVYFLVLVL